MYEYQTTFRTGNTQPVKSKLSQFPLTLCWAQTGHKIQGQTIAIGCTLVIHWTADIGKPGIVFVMLGRCKRLDDIYIIAEPTFDAKFIKCDKDALEETERLEKKLKQHDAV